jgi:hypothetical protein
MPDVKAVEIRENGDIVFLYVDGTEYNSGSEPGEDTYSVAQWLANEANAELRFPVSCHVAYFEEI